VEVRGAVANRIPTVTAFSIAVSKSGIKIWLLRSERILLALAILRAASISDGKVAKPIDRAPTKPDLDLAAKLTILAGVSQIESNPKIRIAAANGKAVCSAS
jgi:hypothetical protein